MTLRSVAVLGGGIAGMVAAYEAARAGVDQVVLVDAGESLGGVVRPVTVAGTTFDASADRVLAAAAVGDLLAGPGGRTEAPLTAARGVVVGGRLHRLPSKSLWGIPLDLSELAGLGLLPPQVLARVPLDHLPPRTPVLPDVSVGEYVGRRLGAMLVDRLVSPYVLAAYAIPSTEVSLRATMPAVHRQARTERSLLRVAQAVAGLPGPRHVAPEGGMHAVVRSLSGRLEESGVRILSGARARSLRRERAGWVVDLEPGSRGTRLRADGLVLAVPAAAAGDLLGPASLGAALALGQIGPGVDVGTVTFAYPRGVLDLQGLAGFGRAESEERHLLGVELPTSTWPWCRGVAPELDVVRVLVGAELLARSDDEVVGAVEEELRFILRGGRATYVDAALTRLPGGLPRYAVGHVERVEAARDAVRGIGSVVICGASYDGTGVTAVVTSARRAVADLLAS